jgi:hypothetical protein
VRVEKLRDLIARLHALPRRRLTLLVAVDGPHAAGKTTFTRALAALDPGLDVIQMEDFALPAEPLAGSPADEAGIGVDWRRLRSHVLLPLSRDQPARYQRYDRNRDSMAEWRMLPVGGIVIVEGRYSCAKALTTFYDFRVWVDAPRDVRRRRCPGNGEADFCSEDAYLTSHDPTRAVHLRVDGSGRVPHDPTQEYVRSVRPSAGRPRPPASP